MIEKIKKTYRLLPPLLARDIKERYAGSTFGVVWTILQPLSFILLYWIIFSQIMKIRIRIETTDVPFIAYLLSGLLPWFAFQEGIMRGANSVVEKRHILKKVLLPTELFPLVPVLSSLIHYFSGFVIFFIIYMSIYKLFSPITIYIIPVIFLQILFTAGLALFFSSISVYIRDTIQVLGTLLQAVFYISTILYPLNAVPKKFKFLIILNPITSMAECYHSILLYAKYPQPVHILYFTIASILSFLIGVYIFRKLKRGFTDVL
jgi:ABC-type polysaccharide/polyol phosphate export permease